jgi:hypothetical protein
MRESTIEKYLHRRVEQAHGTTRKFKSPGRPHVPDRIVIWPDFYAARPMNTRVHFVECKAPGKRPRPGQAREHVRLQKLGCVVLVLDTKEKVDAYVERNKRI